VDDWVLEKLQTRAKGNFLYASLMVKHLRNSTYNVDDVINLITSMVPSDFASIYSRILNQYQKDQHKYVRYEIDVKAG
jgi:hypothetical protein